MTPGFHTGQPCKVYFAACVNRIMPAWTRVRLLRLRLRVLVSAHMACHWHSAEADGGPHAARECA